MSRLVYADTGAFIALMWDRDRAHRTVGAHLSILDIAGDRLITSEPVISETVTRLRYDAGLPRVLAFRTVVQAAVSRNFLTVRESGEDLRRSAFAIIAQYADLRLSYADAVGAAIAGEGRVAAVFGLDNDFRVMDFAVEP